MVDYRKGHRMDVNGGLCGVEGVCVVDQISIPTIPLLDRILSMQADG